MKITRLNEDYLDSVEYRIQRYEDELADVMSHLHAGYVSGMVNAKAYADALQKVFDIFEELDYVDVESLTEDNNVSSQLTPALDSFLQDIAQMYGTISYKDIMDHTYTPEDVKKLSSLRRKFTTEIQYEGEKEANVTLDKIAKDVATIVKCNSVHECDVTAEAIDEYDDDYDSFEMNESPELRLHHKLFTQEDLQEEPETLNEDTESRLVAALSDRGLKLNTDVCSMEDVCEYIDMGGINYSVEQWIDDTLRNYPKYLIRTGKR